MFVICVLFLIVVANLIIGSRGEAISLFVIITIFYNDYKKRFEGVKVLRLVGLGLVVMILIPTIATFRSEENKTVGKFFSTMIENVSVGENNFIVKTISELGCTMYAFVLTEEVVPSVVQYKNGESYLASLLMIIPSQLMGGYSFAPKAALDIWLQDVHQLPYGPGFSLLAETYYNFGYIGGVLFAAMLGYIFSKILSFSSTKKNTNELFRLLSLIFLYNSMLAARFPFHSTPRNLVYMYIIPYIAINIIYKYLKRRSVIYD
jgi:oligosaccharide repeat unit polymerase